MKVSSAVSNAVRVSRYTYGLVTTDAKEPRRFEHEQAVEKSSGSGGPPPIGASPFCATAHIATLGRAELLYGPTVPWDRGEVALTFIDTAVLF